MLRLFYLTFVKVISTQSMGVRNQKSNVFCWGDFFLKFVKTIQLRFRRTKNINITSVEVTYFPSETQANKRRIQVSSSPMFGHQLHGTPKNPKRF